ncbi:MAG: SpoIVB peptidase [Lachnospiraceae bacterium]|nr:SpoIVB peptidase [Lachnospiraceae bacterium]
MSEEVRMKKIQRYRRFLYMMLGNAVCLLLCIAYVSCWHKVPGTIKIRAGMEERIDFGVPASGTIKRSDEAFLPVSLNHPLTFYANLPDDYEMNVRLFGVVPLKHVNVQVIREKEVVPAGLPIGIYVKTQGVLVIGTGEFTGFDKAKYAPSETVLKSGDYILKINGTEVTGKKMFMRSLQELGGDDLILTIRRGDEVFDVKVVPVEDQSGTYKIGIWIRDNAQGVGTLTYIDEDGGFGALGHGINDTDTSTLMTLQKGTLYHTDIIGIRKGETGNPGELTGLIDYADDNVIGMIERNEENGIFGVCKEALEEAATYEPVRIGLKQEVVAGPAKILCSLDGREAKLYDIEITDIVYDEAHVNREIVLRITDEELIRETGGIIQGMSGAPILQNGKLIGAVTHVFVQDATKGYGIFIEEMLE